MNSLHLAAIEQQARQRRAEELQRIQRLMSLRLHGYGQRLGSRLAILSENLRQWFSWNPQARRPS